MKVCGPKCFECIICQGKKTCCSHDWNSGYHACVKWRRDGKESDKNESLETDRASNVRVDSEEIEKKVLITEKMFDEAIGDTTLCYPSELKALANLKNRLFGKTE